MSHITRKSVSRVCNQLRLKPACSATEASKRLEISAIATRCIILSRQQRTKVLIRSRGCAGSSVPLLFAYVINRFSHAVAHDQPQGTLGIGAWMYMYMDHVKRIWYLLPMRAAKVQASLSIRAVSPEPPLLAHTSNESRGTLRQKPRSLAPLNGWACAVKICHDGMLEDTNSLDGAHIQTVFLPHERLEFYSKKLTKYIVSWSSFFSLMLLVKYLN